MNKDDLAILQAERAAALHEAKGWAREAAEQLMRALGDIVQYEAEFVAGGPSQGWDKGMQARAAFECLTDEVGLARSIRQVFVTIVDSAAGYVDLVDRFSAAYRRVVTCLDWPSSHAFLSPDAYLADPKLRLSDTNALFHPDFKERDP